MLPAHRAARPEWKTGWERIRLDSMCANLRTDMLVFDIGAEEGDLPALWATWGCRVVLVEPNPKVWPNPKCIWEANDLPPPAATFNGFVADTCQGEASALRIGGWPTEADGEVIGDHGFRVVTEWPEAPRITIDRLSELVGQPDAITMDIEGAELLALQGATKTLCDAGPLVWVSVHPAFMADTFRHRVTDVWELFRACGYEYRLLDYDHELHVFAWPSSMDVVLPW